MSEKTSNVKKEIRVLGLDTCGHNAVVGAVNRGAFYLDGVLIFPRLKGGSIGLAQDIGRTKHFPELKAVMLHDPRALLDMTSIEATIKLPCLTVSTGLDRPDSNFNVFQNNRRQVWVKSQLESLSLHKILSSTWISGHLPEPVRIAHLLATSARYDRVRIR